MSRVPEILPLKTDNQKGWDKLKEAEWLEFHGRYEWDKIPQREQLWIRSAFDYGWGSRHGYASSETFERRDLPPPTPNEEQIMGAQSIWDELTDDEKSAIRHWTPRGFTAAVDGWSIVGGAPDHVTSLVTKGLLESTPYKISANTRWYTLTPTGLAVAQYAKEQQP